MKFRIHLSALLFVHALLQGSESKPGVNPLNESLSCAPHINDQISQHLSHLELNRKQVLLVSAQALTLSQTHPKITRGILKDVCEQLPQVLLDTPADNNIKTQVYSIQGRFHRARFSSCYGCIPFWKSHSNGIIRQEAIDLKQAINRSLYVEKLHHDASEHYEAPVSTAQAAFVPLQTAAPYNPEFIPTKNEK